MSRKIGILGGSFNPLHNGHIHLAEGFRAALGLDRVLLVPVARPPHKPGDNMAPGVLRLRMCALAAEGRPWISPCALELARGGKSYTSETLAALRRLYPDDTLCLLMGADMFLTLEHWHDFQQIARLAVLCSTQRPGGGGARELGQYARRLREAYGARCEIARLSPIDLSSTEIREKIARAESVEGLVPEGVRALIETKGLYKTGV